MKDYESISTSNGLFLLSLKDIHHRAYYKNYKIKTIDSCIDEDWKTFIAQRKPLIPKDTIFTEYEILQNFYGLFFDVKYKGYKYSVDPKYVELLEK